MYSLKWNWEVLMSTNKRTPYTGYGINGLDLCTTKDSTTYCVGWSDTFRMSMYKTGVTYGSGKKASLVANLLGASAAGRSDDRAVPVLHHKLARCKLDSSPSSAQPLVFYILLRRITSSLPTVTTGPRQQWRRQLLPACPVPRPSLRTSCRRCQPPPSSRSSSATSTMPLLGVYGQGQKQRIWRRARRSSSCRRYAHKSMAWRVRGAHEHLLTGRVDRLGLPAY
jgi:hypothetical protein